MAEETLDPSLIEQTKNQIRRLVGEIAELAESDIQPQEFGVEFMNRVVAAVAASGGALWMLDPRGGLRMQHQLEFRQTGLLDGRVKTLGCPLLRRGKRVCARCAYGEGMGRSRSGPTSIHSGVVRAPRPPPNPPALSWLGKVDPRS